jgi:hypothetical protein
MATKRSRPPAPLHGTWSVGVRAVVALSAVAVLGATVTLSRRGDAQELRARLGESFRATLTGPAGAPPGSFGTRPRRIDRSSRPSGRRTSY